MTKSALQIARAAYQPKLPKALKGAVKVKEGLMIGHAEMLSVKETQLTTVFPSVYKKEIK